VLQVCGKCVASVLQRAAECCNELTKSILFSNILPANTTSVAVCCSVSQCVASMLHVCCSVLQGCCSVLCVAVCCSVLEAVAAQVAMWCQDRFC